MKQHDGVPIKLAISTKYPKHFASKFRAYSSVIQAIVPPLSQIVNIDTILFDTLNEFNIATHLFTPLEEGYYVVIAQTEWGIGLLAGIIKTLSIEVNGVVQCHVSDESIVGVVNRMQISTILHLTPNDTVGFYVAHNDVANRNISPNNDATYFSCFRIG